MKEFIKKMIYKIPIIGSWKKDVDTYKTYYPPGHYANPFPSIQEVNKYADRIFDNKKKLYGINLRKEEQFFLLQQLSENYSKLIFSDSVRDGNRYFYNNPMYSYCDGIFLFLILLHIKPTRLIEIGSGFSSALLLDVVEKEKLKTKLTFIEPFPERLYRLISEKDKVSHQIISKPIQEVDLSLFDTLEKDDILFLDTSHILKTASDLYVEIFEILPRLKPGVIIHIHDIFPHFEYPKEWIYKQKAYNEAYFLKSFLMYNEHYEMVLMNSWIQQEFSAYISEHMPLVMKSKGSSLWLKKIK